MGSKVNYSKNPNGRYRYDKEIKKRTNRTKHTNVHTSDGERDIGHTG